MNCYEKPKHFQRKTFKKEQKKFKIIKHKKSQKQKNSSSFGEVMKLFEEKMKKKQEKSLKKGKSSKKSH